jgi:hypothetical protein
MEKGTQFTTVTAAEAHRTLTALHGEDYTGVALDKQRPRVGQEKAEARVPVGAMREAMIHDTSGNPLKNHEEDSGRAHPLVSLYNGVYLDSGEITELDRYHDAGYQHVKQVAGKDQEEVSSRVRKTASGESVDLDAEGLEESDNTEGDLPYNVAYARRRKEVKGETEESMFPTSVGEDGKVYAHPHKVILDIARGTHQSIMGTTDVDTGTVRRSRRASNRGDVVQSLPSAGGVSVSHLSKSPHGRALLTGMEPDPDRAKIMAYRKSDNENVRTLFSDYHYIEPEERVNARRYLVDNKPEVKKYLEHLPVTAQPKTKAEKPSTRIGGRGTSFQSHVLGKLASGEPLEPIEVVHHAGGGTSVPDLRHRMTVAVVNAFKPNMGLQFKHTYEDPSQDPNNFKQD